ncbi:MAG: type II secretion system F family protein [Ardenticatenaceae bacterium]|nr:type II secretion system F family protein [Anaerolineales bacterium]MCB9007127.1 type II secretion system F family protein [Ardenticatenaceae bacterium]
MSPLVIIAGAFAILLMLGAGIAIVVTGNQSSVDERLEQFVGTATVVELPESVDVDDGPDVADRLDKALSGQNFFGPIRERISRADAKLRVSEYVILVFASGVLTAVIGYFLPQQNSWVIAIFAGLLGLRIPRFYVRTMAKRRMQAFDAQLSDTLNLWVNALRSGYSVLQAMEAIATELPPPVSAEFERVVQEVRLGLSVEQALANMYRRVPSEDLDLVITAVNIQREVGGNLAEVLDTISYTIRERVRIKGEIRTLTAQGRVSGWIISLLPLVLGFILYLINPEYVSELWVREDPWVLPQIIPCGWIVMAFSGIMIGAGAYAISKIVDIEV